MRKTLTLTDDALKIKVVVHVAEDGTLPSVMRMATDFTEGILAKDEDAIQMAWSYASIYYHNELVQWNFSYQQAAYGIVKAMLDGYHWMHEDKPFGVQHGLKSLQGLCENFLHAG